MLNPALRRHNLEMVMHLHEASDAYLSNFDGLVAPLIHCVQRSWDVRMTPRGLDPATGKIHDIFAGDPLFNGPRNICGRHLSFPESMTASSAAAQKDPLATLVAASVTYGMDVENEHTKRRIKAAQQKMADLATRMTEKAETSAEVAKALEEFRAFANFYLAEVSA